MKLFTRKPKNRIRSRGHVLNVKLNTQQTRAMRLRWLGLGVSILGGALFVLFIFWQGGRWLIEKMVYENDAFAIQQPIDVRTDGVILPEQLRRWAMVKPGENLLALDLSRVKRDLELVPLIQSATVERVLPHTLRIRVSEREPVAQIIFLQKTDVSYAPVVYHIDDQGFVMEPLDPKLRSKPPEISPAQMPVISGVMARDLRPGRRVESGQVLAALDLLGEFDRSPMAGLVDLQRIDISAPEVLHIYTAQGTEVIFPVNRREKKHDRFDLQLRRWRMVWDQSQRWNKSISQIDLSISNNVPLRLLDVPVSTKVVASRTIKTPRTRKKHV